MAIGAIQDQRNGLAGARPATRPTTRPFSAGALDGANPSLHSQAEIEAMARKVVAVSFFGTMFKQMRASSQDTLFSGGQAGKTFQTMLDGQLAERMASAPAGDRLSHSIARRLAKSHDEPTTQLSLQESQHTPPGRRTKERPKMSPQEAMKVPPGLSRRPLRKPMELDQARQTLPGKRNTDPLPTMSVQDALHTPAHTRVTGRPTTRPSITLDQARKAGNGIYWGPAPQVPPVSSPAESETQSNIHVKG